MRKSGIYAEQIRAMGKAVRLLRLRKGISMASQGVGGGLGLLERGLKNAQISSYLEACELLGISMGEVWALAEEFMAGSPELEAELKWRHDAMTKKGRPSNT